MGRNREDCEKCYPESTSDKGRYPYRESPQSWKATPLGSHDDASDNDDADRLKLTRSIVAKFTFWKHKEKVLRAARQKPGTEEAQGYQTIS